MKVLNDLYDYEGIKIYQDDNFFKFSLDSILLAEFTKINKKDKVLVDFCAGNGAIPLIISTKSTINMWGIEFQKVIYDLACESILYNKLEKQIEILNDTINNVKKYFKAETVDIVTCNPPYFKKFEKSMQNEVYEKSVARHEITMNLEDIFVSATYILKNKGNLNLVHRPERLEEIFCIAGKYGLSAKKVQLVYSDFNNNAILVLINFVKNGKTGLKMLKPIEIKSYESYKGIVGD